MKRKDIIFFTILFSWLLTIIILVYNYNPSESWRTMSFLSSISFISLLCFILLLRKITKFEKWIEK